MPSLLSTHTEDCWPTITCGRRAPHFWTRAVFSLAGAVERECLLEHSGKNHSFLWLLVDAFRGDGGFVWQCDGGPPFHPQVQDIVFPFGLSS